MMLARISPRLMGFEHRRFECPKCSSVQNEVVSSDPMKSASVGWLAGETQGSELRGGDHARQTEPGSAMHGLRFSHEIDGD